MEENEAILEIDNFIKNLLNKSNQIDIIKLLRCDIQHFSRILSYYRNIKKDLQEQFKTNLLLCLNYYTSFLINTKQDLSNALILLNIFDSDLIVLYIQSKYMQFYIELTIKHIICLIKANYTNEAISRAYTLAHLYKDLRIKHKDVNSNLEEFKKTSYNLIQIRNTILYMENECKKNNYYNDRKRFKILSKKIELQIYKLNIDYDFDDKINIASKISFSGGLTDTIVLYSNLFNIKGFRKLKYILFNYIKIISNNFLNFFWGYGESIPKIVRSSLIVVFIYTILMQSGLVKVVDPKNSSIIKGFFNHLYFSIVTFTSLGYGDISPHTDTISRLIMSSEAIVGLICISLIIFVISRRR